MDRDETVGLLNDLIQILEDSHLSLQRAAEDCADAPSKALLNDIAARRAAMVRDLQRIVASIGGAPEATGTLLGGAQRLFAEIRAALGNRADGAILEHLAAGEAEAIRRLLAAAERDGLAESIRAGLLGHAERVAVDRDLISTRAAEAA